MSKYRNEKYYWFKLKDDFFKRHDIKIIKSMPNGKDYVIFYLQLLCESLSHNGKLRFNEEIPYNEEMLSVITDTNIDVVRSAMKLFKQLKIIEIMDDQTIYMTKLQNMVGSTTIGADKKKLQRSNSIELLTGGQKADKCPPEIDIEKEIEIDIDSKNECMNEYIEETNNTCVRASYEEIMQEFGVSKLVQLKLFEFIKHLKLHNVVMINSRLESIIVGLDMRYREDVDRIACIDRAIVGGDKKLEFE
jgi:predicted phage replisome organizer